MKQIRQLSKKGILPVLAIAILYPLIMGVFHQSYLILLGSYAMLYIIVVSGIDVLFGYSGQITMGHAGFYAIGAYGTAIIHNYLNLPPMLSILSHLVGYVSPDTFVRKQSVMFVTMLLFGGSASVGGTITGVIFVLILTELLRALQDYQVVIYGVLMLVAIVALPGGLYGGIRQLLDQLRSRADQRKEARVHAER